MKCVAPLPRVVSRLFILFPSPAAVSPLCPSPGCLGSCLHELSTALSTIFLTRLVLTNLHSILLASWTNEEKRRAEMEGVEPGAILTPAEREYAMEPYDGLMTTFRNFAELAVQYGYATLFAAAFPLSPIMAMLNNYIKIRYVV